MLDPRATARYWGNVGLLAGLCAVAAYTLWAIGGPWSVGWWPFLLAWLLLLGVSCVATAFALVMELVDAWPGRGARRPLSSEQPESATPHAAGGIDPAGRGL